MSNTYETNSATRKAETMITKNAPYRFINLNTARSFSNNCIKSHMIVMGDDSRYWVVTPADATRLVKAGYETIK